MDVVSWVVSGGTSGSVYVGFLCFDCVALAGAHGCVLPYVFMSGYSRCIEKFCIRVAGCVDVLCVRG